MEKMYVGKPFLLALIGVLLIAGIFTAGVSAGSLSLDIPDTTANTGDTITIPVIIHDAQDIAGMTIDVANNVPGAVITIDKKSRPIDFGSYLFNSNESNELQRVVWFSDSGFTMDNYEIFSLQVKILSSNFTEVPITITPVTIVNSSSGFLTDEYPLVGVNSVQFSGSGVTASYTQTTSPTLSSGSSTSTSTSTSSSKNTGGKVSSSSETPVPTVTSSSSSNKGNEQNNQQTTPVQTTTTSVPTAPSASSNPSSTQSSPLGLFPLMALGFAGLLTILKKK